MDKRVIISEGVKPLWQRIIAAILLTIMFYFIIAFFTNTTPSFVKGYVKGITGLFELCTLIIITALPFATTRNYIFDFQKNKFKIEYRIGHLKFGKWEALPKLEYISVYKKEDDFYELNLWYYKNKHVKIFQYSDFDDAMKEAFEFSEELNIDLLDASEKNNFSWVDKEVFKKSGKIVHID
ncbi:hypothetical protein [Urechidicola croceus]|uniref:Uncharacterized protein n=1 Tax=Urechidicola croceus TaxID=1850246 RepID=A0A1D8P8L9_9FLAO|nr:hypothetical protein [Urechidicola croceus]AOW20927.1 hypothetical protein LPB138_09695 [Urechidicola croceus]